MINEIDRTIAKRLLDGRKTMKLKYSFETIEMDDHFIAVPVGEKADEVKGVLKLNREGADILGLLNTETSIQGITNNLAQKYESDETEIKKYVEKFIKTLEDKQLLDT